MNIGLTAEEALGAARVYTKKTVKGMGAIKGSPCMIKKVYLNETDRRTEVTYTWEGTDGSSNDTLMYVPWGINGISIVDVTINADNQFVFKTSDGNTLNPVDIPIPDVPLSKKDGNAIVKLDDGFYVANTGVLISNEGDNILENLEDGLYVGEISVSTVKTETNDTKLILSRKNKVFKEVLLPGDKQLENGSLVNFGEKLEKTYFQYSVNGTDIKVYVENKVEDELQNNELVFDKNLLPIGVVTISDDKTFFSFTDNYNNVLECPLSTVEEKLVLIHEAGLNLVLNVKNNPNSIYISFKELDDRLTDIENKLVDLQLYKFPNVIIHGNPTINNGQISNFSSDNYLAFPFLVDFGDRDFTINMAFTTGADVINQQNIIDGRYGLALAIKDKHFVLALSSNGQSWDIGVVDGTYEVKPETNYYLKLTFNRLEYRLSYSLDKEVYTDDIVKVASQRPYPVQTYIGIGDLGTDIPKPFGGIINMNYSDVYVGSTLIWQGMDDVGLATRLSVDLENIDAAGVSRIEAIADLEANKELIKILDRLYSLGSIGANLINPIYVDGNEVYKNNGITFTIQEDGGINAYGALTEAQSIFKVNGDNSDTTKDTRCSLEEGKYLLKCCPTGGSASTYYVKIKDTTKNTDYFDYGEGVLIEVSKGEVVNLDIQIIILTSLSSSKVFKPSIVNIYSNNYKYEDYVKPSRPIWTIDADVVNKLPRDLKYTTDANNCYAKELKYTTDTCGKQDVFLLKSGSTNLPFTESCICIAYSSFTDIDNTRSVVNVAYKLTDLVNCEIAIRSGNLDYSTGNVTWGSWTKLPSSVAVDSLNDRLNKAVNNEYIGVNLLGINLPNINSGTYGNITVDKRTEKSLLGVVLINIPKSTDKVTQNVALNLSDTSNKDLRGLDLFLSGCPKNGGSTKYCLEFGYTYDAEQGDWNYLYDTGDGVRIPSEVTTGMDEWSIELRVMKDAVLGSTQLSFKPMLVEVNKDGTHNTSFIPALYNNRDLTFNALDSISKAATSVKSLNEAIPTRMGYNISNAIGFFQCYTTYKGYTGLYLIFARYYKKNSRSAIVNQFIMTAGSSKVYTRFGTSNDGGTTYNWDDENELATVNYVDIKSRSILDFMGQVNVGNTSGSEASLDFVGENIEDSKYNIYHFEVEVYPTDGGSSMKMMLASIDFYINELRSIPNVGTYIPLSGPFEGCYINLRTPSVSYNAEADEYTTTFSVSFGKASFVNLPSNTFSNLFVRGSARI